MKKNIVKCLGLIILAIFTFISCKKENSSSSNSAASSPSGYNINVDNKSFKFDGDKSGLNKDTTMGAIIMKDNNSEMFNLMLFKVNKTDTVIDFLLSTSFSTTSLLSSNLKYGIKYQMLDSTNTMKNDKVEIYINNNNYGPYDVQLSFSNSNTKLEVGSIFSGSIIGKVYNEDVEYTNIEDLPSISGSFKVVYIDNIWDNNSSNGSSMSSETKKNIIESYYKLLKAQKD